MGEAEMRLFETWLQEMTVHSRSGSDAPRSTRSTGRAVVTTSVSSAVMNAARAATTSVQRLFMTSPWVAIRRTVRGLAPTTNGDAENGQSTAADEPSVEFVSLRLTQSTLAALGGLAAV